MLRRHKNGDRTPATGSEEISQAVSAAITGAMDALTAGQPRWRVPATCPNCGAAIDQATQSLADQPRCHYCEEPLPTEPVGGALDVTNVVSLGGDATGAAIVGGIGAIPAHQADPAIGGAAHILEAGDPARAVLLATVPLQEKNRLGEDVVGLVLLVTVGQQAPFQAQVGLHVPPEATGLLTVGADLPAKVLAGYTDAVAIDWSAALAEAGGTAG